MLKILHVLISFSFITLALVQSDAYLKEIKDYRRNQNEEFLNPNSSPLSTEEIKSFNGHEFYPVNEAYRLKARFEATPNAKPFQLGTSKGGVQIYRRLGILHFELKGEKLTLEAYLRVQSFGMRQGGNKVFLPIVDQTAGESTYEAGRYLHFDGIPEGDEWIIDFNKLYNPYCAYNERYECPLVPEANHLPIKVEAGVRGY